MVEVAEYISNLIIWKMLKWHSSQKQARNIFLNLNSANGLIDLYSAFQGIHRHLKENKWGQKPLSKSHIV